MLRYDLMGLSLDAIRGGMMPRPIRGRLSLHPFRERTSCGSRLNALAQVACLWLRSFLQIEVFASLVQAGRLSLHPIRVSVGCMATPSTSQDPAPTSLTYQKR